MVENIYITQPAEGPICDFCSRRPVTARYHAKSFEVKSVMVPTPWHQMSEGDWAACCDCEKLLDANDWEGIVARASVYFFMNHPELKIMCEMAGMPFDEFKKKMKEDFWSMYRQLRENDFYKTKL